MHQVFISAATRDLASARTQQLDEILEECFEPLIHIPPLISGDELDPAKELFV